MTAQLILAPAGAGKTDHIVGRAIEASRVLRPVWVLLPNARQRRALSERLAAHGGALGVQVTTFSQLYEHLLAQSGLGVSQLHDVVRLRLLRACMDDLVAAGRLPYYGGLVRKPGLVALVGEMIRDCKQAMVGPDDLERAWSDDDIPPRLTELAAIYGAYQTRLRANDWSDVEGLGWLALQALRDDPDLAGDWRLCLVDGFDHLNVVQIEILRCLQERVQDLVITLTGQVGTQRPMAQAIFARTQKRLCEALGVLPEPLPEGASAPAKTAAGRLHAALFESQSRTALDADDDYVTLIEAPDRVQEVREALRWCKARIVQDGVPPSDVALLARGIEPYRPYLLDMAREMGLPVGLASGMPLAENPAVSSLLDLLALMVPDSESGQPLLPRRGVISAWRCPYFDWGSALAVDGESLPITLADALALDLLSRQGVVIQGLMQWREALDAMLERDPDAQDADGEALDSLPLQEAEYLRQRFDAFVARMSPPVRASYRGYVSWLEELIGGDPLEVGDLSQNDGSLGLLRRLYEERNQGDRCAMRSLVSVLRGLVWAQERLGVGLDVSYAEFLSELDGAVQASSFRLDEQASGRGVLVADVEEARGVSYRAVAVMGLAEGEFPRIVREDPLLRDADRELLREHGLPIDDKVRADEGTRFYQAVSRARDWLLLTRPRLGERGAEWQPSPYWQAVRRLTAAQPQRMGGDQLGWDRVASRSELLTWAAGQVGGSKVLDNSLLARWRAVEQGAGVVNARAGYQGAGPYDGDLSTAAHELSERFGPSRAWSATALQTYIACPLQFLFARVLGLEPVVEPQEGMDATVGGSIQHAILELVFRREGGTDLDALLQALPEVAEEVLSDAPRRYGFRATAWWQVEQQEIIERIGLNLVAMAEDKEAQRWTPCAYEASFGLGDGSAGPLEIDLDGQTVRLRGKIDRVDRDAQGQVRIIDYKSGSSSGSSFPSLQRGEKLQLPLYAMAAERALGFGEPVDGFYWHLADAKRSGLTLAKCGYEAACEILREHLRQVLLGVRSGEFGAQVPSNGCPTWCPAAGFCWRYREGYRSR